MFIIGLTVGLFIGANLGLVVTGLLFSRINNEVYTDCVENISHKIKNQAEIIEGC